MDPNPLVRLGGLAHLASLAAILVAARAVRWHAELSRVPRLLHQMCSAYHAYTTGTIIALGLVSLLLPDQLTNGSPLARAVCGYTAIFWLARLVLQFTYDARAYLPTVAHRLAFHSLTALFIAFISLYGWLAIRA